MEDNRLWFLIARHLSKEITAEESEELQTLLSQHPHKQYLFDILHSYFNLPDESEEKDLENSPFYEQKFLFCGVGTACFHFNQNKWTGSIKTVR